MAPVQNVVERLVVTVKSRATSREALWSAAVLWRSCVAITCALFFAGSLLAGTNASAPSIPKRGGILRLARPTDPKSLDPAYADASQDLLLQPLLYQPLLDLTNGNAVVNNLTRSWEMSSDGFAALAARTVGELLDRAMKPFLQVQRVCALAGMPGSFLTAVF